MTSNAEQPWQQDTPTKSDTVVYFYHSMHNYLEVDYVKACLSALQVQCASACLELSISTQQNRGGQVVSIVTTKGQEGLVAALIASVKFSSEDSIAPAVIVNDRNHDFIRFHSSQRSN